MLLERVSWRLAFRTVVFMPMAVSLFAAGVIWRIMDQKEPSRGTLNASIQVVHDEFSPTGQLQGALPSTGAMTGSREKGYRPQDAASQPGGTALLPLTGILPEAVPKGAKQAAAPTVSSDQVGGVVWRDFKPGGGTPGKLDSGELGLPGVNAEALRRVRQERRIRDDGRSDGSFTIDGVGPGQYRAEIAPANFTPPYGGVSWLGPKLITPSLIIAYLWVWAGFAMVVIAAGLAAIPRDTLEAARTDGAIGVAGLPPRDRAAARARADGRLHHDADQRLKGLRRRVGGRAAVGAGRRERDRARDVAHVVRRRERLRARLRDRGVPVPARAADPAAEHSPLPEGGLMATAAASRGAVVRRRTTFGAKLRSPRQARRCTSSSR